MNRELAISTESPKVFFSNSRLVTSSQAIADYFDKQHKHVLEKIRSLDCSPEFATANFPTVVIKVQAGLRRHTSPRLTRWKPSRGHRE
nr:Rha family transcriptional regulator [Enterobacter ludwigii]